MKATSPNPSPPGPIARPVAALDRSGRGATGIVARGGRAAAVLLIRAYQACIRPHLIGQCKYYPTCSEYGIEALQRHGLLRGGWLTLRRLLRCHPFARGGIDPVPPEQS